MLLFFGEAGKGTWGHTGRLFSHFIGGATVRAHAFDAPASYYGNAELLGKLADAGYAVALETDEDGF